MRPRKQIAEKQFAKRHVHKTRNPLTSKRLVVALAVGIIAALTAVLSHSNRPPKNQKQTASSIEAHPATPKSLAELLGLPQIDLASVDIARMNLLCAQGLPGAENLDVETSLATLEPMGELRTAADRPQLSPLPRRS